MNDKRIIETFKQVRAVERAQPDPSLQITARNDLMRMIDRAWAEAKANPKVRNDTEGLQILRGLIDTETNPDKREIHERIFGIATRLAHRKKPLSVSGGASQSDSVSEPLPLHEQIKFLREQKN
jgi:hypothetical protein